MVSVSPLDGATGVGTATDIKVHFSEPIDSASITSVDFTLASAAGVVIDIVSYDAGADTATLHPSALLSAGTTYTARISGAKDLAGNVLFTPVEWNFTTAVGPLQHKLRLPIILR